MNTSNNTVLGWGPAHLFAQTPAWASKTVSVLLTLIAVYGAFILKFPDVVPAAVSVKIASGISILMWFFQAYGLMPVEASAPAPLQGDRGASNTEVGTDVLNKKDPAPEPVKRGFF